MYAKHSQKKRGRGSSSNLNVLNDIHIRAARCIMKIKKSVPKDRVLQICNWNSMEHYYKKSITCKTYKIYNNQSPPLLRNLIEKPDQKFPIEINKKPF